MRRKSVLLTLLILVVTVALVGGGFAAAVKHEPDFYTALPTVTGYDATERSSRLVTHVQDLKNDIRSKADWGAQFTADDLNCFFRENLTETGGLVGVLPQNCHSPRVQIEGETIRVGLRYGTGSVSAVLWLELKAWLVKDEVNLVAVELCGLNAGGLPIGCQSLLDTISEAAHDSNVEVTWYRNNGNPVGLFRFYADQIRPTTQITTLRVADGSITVAGRTKQETPAVGLPGAGD